MNKSEAINLKNNSRVLSLSPVLVEKLGSFSNKEPDLDSPVRSEPFGFEFSNPATASASAETSSVPSVADLAEQTNSTPLPKAIVIKKTTIIFLYRTTLQNTKLKSA